jgi:hypothetical protein
MRTRTTIFLAVAALAVAIPVSANASLANGIPAGMQACFDETAAVDPPGLMESDCAYVINYTVDAAHPDGSGWYRLGGVQNGGGVDTPQKAVTYAESDFVFPSGSCDTSYLGDSDGILYVATAPGCVLDGETGDISSLTDTATTGTWVSHALSLDGISLMPSIPVSSYADNLLTWILNAAASIWIYAAAISAFVIGVGLMQRWIGRRNARNV